MPAIDGAGHPEAYGCGVYVAKASSRSFPGIFHQKHGRSSSSCDSLKRTSSFATGAIRRDCTTALLTEFERSVRRIGCCKLPTTKPRRGSLAAVWPLLSTTLMAFPTEADVGLGRVSGFRNSLGRSRGGGPNRAVKCFGPASQNES